MNQQKHPPKRSFPLKKILRIALTVLLTILIIAVFYLAVVLGQPTDADTVTAENQPLLSPSPAVNISSEGELGSLIRDFPTPVLSFVSGTGPAMTAGSSYDTAFEDGFARVLELHYTLEDGRTVQIQSIYPARALSLMERGDYHLNQMSSVSLAGLKAVRMEDSTTIRLHAQSDDALYIIILPQMTSDEISTLTKGLQLVTAASGEDSSAKN